MFEVASGSDGFPQENGGVSRRGRTGCLPKANYAFPSGEGGPHEGVVDEEIAVCAQ